MPRADAAILAVERIDEHRVERPERIVADLDFVAAEPRIDAEEDVEQLDIGKIAMHGALFAFQEVGDELLDVHVAHERAAHFVA